MAPGGAQGLAEVEPGFLAAPVQDQVGAGWGVGLTAQRVDAHLGAGVLDVRTVLQTCK